MIGTRKPAHAVVADVLEMQYKALLQGDLARLATMATELAQAFNRLRRERALPNEVAPLMIAAARNARLLQAAQAGVAQARAHLQSAREPDLTTYDAKGRSQPGIAHPSRTLLRR